MKKKQYLQILIPIVSILISLFIGGIFIYSIGKNPFFVYSQLIRGTFGSSYDIGQVLFKATPLMYTGLAVAIAFRAGLFNIGADGQLYIGAIFTAISGIYIPMYFPLLPTLLIAPLCMFMGFIGGGIWGIIPGYLRARFGIHEVINTIMMNFIAYGITNYLVLDIFIVPETVHTPSIGDTARIPRMDALTGLFKGSPVNASFLFALVACLLIWYLIYKTRLGYEIRAVGLNPQAAEYAGINVSKITVAAFLISGGLAGLVGTNFVQGYKYYFEDGFATGAGFMGIAVALVGQNHPLGIVFSALLFAILSQGGLVINTIIPKELMEILQAIIILVMVVMTEVLKRYLKKQMA